MTPDDLRTVQRSWASLAPRRAELLPALARQFTCVGIPPADAAVRAGWLLCAVGELVDLLPVPSQLATRARALGETWPDPRTAPSFAVDGQAWLAAAAACLPSWSGEVTDAWRQAWLLLSEVVAAEALSPFAADPLDPRPPAVGGHGPNPGGARTEPDAAPPEEGDHP